MLVLNTIKTVMVVLFVLMADMTYANDVQDVYGVWSTDGNSAQVKIQTCEQGVCGTLIWLNPNSLDTGETAETVKDRHNKDLQLADRNLLGLTMLWGFKPAKRGWSGGKIYDPESGKTYTSKLKRIDEESLEVKGCISLFCQGQTWTRVLPQD